MYRYILSILFVVILGSTAVRAQGNSAPVGRAFDQMFIIGWDVNIPMGSDKFVEDISWAGGKLEYRKMIDDKFSVGIDLSWNSYYTYKSYQTFHVNTNTDITTDLYKYLYTLPMAITADYYIPSHGIFVPYVGLGIGATYAEPKLYTNIYEANFENWGFLIRPELGTIIKFDPASDMGILVAARYSASTNQESVLKIDNLQALGFQLGFTWLY
jgi:hypothetical protein